MGLLVAEQISQASFLTIVSYQRISRTSSNNHRSAMLIMICGKKAKSSLAELWQQLPPRDAVSSQLSEVQVPFAYLEQTDFKTHEP